MLGTISSPSASRKEAGWKHQVARYGHRANLYMLRKRDREEREALWKQDSTPRWIRR